MKINMCRCHEDKRDIWETNSGDSYSVYCLGCGYDTGKCATREEAVKEWNEMVKR